MRKKLAFLMLFAVVMSTASAEGQHITVQVDGVPLSGAAVREGITYVPLRELMEGLGGWELLWDGRAATARSDLMEMTFPVGEKQLYIDGYEYAAPAAYLQEGRTWVPLRTVAELCGAEVVWRGWSEPVEVMAGRREIREDELYWLSRIISAESKGESLLGQLAVGAVVLNRVEDPDYPNTIYSVIFEYNHAYQFEPVENGTVYQAPTEQSLLAARLCLNGTRVLEDCLYFFNPDLAEGTWIRENREYL